MDLKLSSLSKKTSCRFTKKVTLYACKVVRGACLNLGASFCSLNCHITDDALVFCGFMVVMYKRRRNKMLLHLIFLSIISILSWKSNNCIIPLHSKIFLNTFSINFMSLDMYFHIQVYISKMISYRMISILEIYLYTLTMSPTFCLPPLN